MSFSATSVVGQAREFFNDLTETRALEYLNDARPLLLSRLNQRRTSRSISLTSGTQTYAFTNSLKVDAVRYRRSASREDYRELVPISKDEALDHSRWPAHDNDEPRYYWLETGTTGPLIGFHPIPDTTTSAGYPVVEVFGTDTNTITISDTIYDDVPDKYLYVSAICLRHARSRMREQVPFWDAEHKRSLAEASEFLTNKQFGNEGVKIVPAWKRGS